MPTLTAQLIQVPSGIAQVPDRARPAAVLRGIGNCAETTEYQSVLGDGQPWIELPVVNCPYPRLKWHGWVELLSAGEYSNNGANNQIAYTLMVDGVATGSDITTSVIASFGNTNVGRVLIEARFIVLGAIDAAGSQVLKITTSVWDNALTSRLSETAVQFYTVSNTADHQIGLRVRRATNAGTLNTLSIKSNNGLHMNPPSDS